MTITSAIYLTGSSIEPIDFGAQSGEPDWRCLAMTRLERYGMRVLNPLELTWSEIDPESSSERRIRRALDLIDQCDAVLANLIKPSYGSAMEIFYAYRKGKMVTVVGNQPFNPWVLSHSQARFADVDHALDYLIGEQPHIDPISWSLHYEGHLSEHYEQFPHDGEPDYQFLGGDLPVLILAPHATGYFRDSEFQEPDAFSGSIAALLNRLSHCHSLVSIYCLAADPCWHLETPMRRAFADIIKAGKVGLVILLQGAPWHEAPGLQIASWGPESSGHKDFASLLKQHLSALEPVMNEQQPLEPLTRFTVEELGVPVVSLKMHKRYRMPRLQPETFSQLVRQLEKFVSQVGVDLLRSHN